MPEEKLEEKVQFRVAAKLKEEFEAFCNAKKISHQDAMGALIEWIMKQEELVQSIVLGQVKGDAFDLIASEYHKRNRIEKMASVSSLEAIEEIHVMADRIKAQVLDQAKKKGK